MRRGGPELIVGLLLVVLLASYVVYTRRVVQDLRGDALRSSQMYARIFRARTDTSDDASTLALLDLSTSIREQGVPLIVTDRNGNPTANANLPDDIAKSDARIRDYVRELDRQNAPVVDSLVGEVHFGNSPLVRWLRIIPALQATSAFLLILAAAFIVRTRGNAERERVWAGMARESAHQLGTPLSSLSGWIELLEERLADPPTMAAVDNMRTDLVRLDRVAHRFERIGREARRERVDLSSLVTRVGSYFSARVPALANAVRIDVHSPPDSLYVLGDAVLVEWALEVLIKNAVDALAGRGGRVDVTLTARRNGGARIVVADDGPGIPRELRGRVFDAGFSTKSGGWGIGLSLARRIIEENHDGSLRLVQANRGASFEIILPA